MDQGGIEQMRKRIGALLVTGAAAALAIGMSTTSSFAATATTWSVSPGGAIKGAAGTTTLKDTTTGTTLTCTSSALTGSLKSGSGLSGAGIGTVTSVSFTNCTVAGQTLSLSSGTVAWKLNAASYASGVTHGTIGGIHLAISSSVCSAIIDGTGATAHNGKVKITYNNGTHKLRVLAGTGNLHVYNVNGCLGLINNGDAGSISSSYLVSPGQKITSP
jgi:hypothetical protein